MSQHGSESRIAVLATDPLRFFALCWPGTKLSEKQRDVVLSVRDHCETFVHAANELGKTRIAAMIAVWWFASRTPARVITSSSSETQLNSILWSEIRHLIATSAYPLPFRVTSLRVEKLKDPRIGETEPRDFIIGHVTNEVENFQGHHLPNDKPRVLVIFDEASGVPDNFFDAADSWAHRKLVIGNPLSTTNFFYRLCRGGDVPDPAGGAGLLRKVIHISGLDSPNVQIGIRWKEKGNPGPPPVVISGLLTYDEFVRREATWDDVKKTTRLYGRFYEGDQALLFPMQWLDAAMNLQRWQELKRRQRTVEAVGVDVAAGGRDNSCWTLIDRFGLIEQIVLDLSNTMEIVGHTVRLIQTHNLPADCVAIDAGGGGKQIADRLHEQGFYVRSIGFGEAADDSQAHKNRRAELYGNLRRLLDPERENGGFLLPPDAAELRQELAILPLQYDSEGKMFLPPKDPRPNQATHIRSLRQILGRSPDRADSLALAAWALRKPASYYDGPLICSGDPGDDEPLTPEDIEELPAFFRELVEESNALAKDRVVFGDRWGE
jgi:Terminase-like family.